MVKEANKPAIDESLLLQLLDKEAEETQKLTNLDYLETIEKFQEMLSNVEQEKEILKQEKEGLNAALIKYRNVVDQIVRENQVLHSEYGDILSKNDIMSMKKTTLEKEKEELYEIQ